MVFAVNPTAEKTFAAFLVRRSFPSSTKSLTRFSYHLRPLQKGRIPRPPRLLPAQQPALLQLALPLLALALRRPALPVVFPYSLLVRCSRCSALFSLSRYRYGSTVSCYRALTVFFYFHLPACMYILRREPCERGRAMCPFLFSRTFIVTTPIDQVLDDW